MIHFTKYAIQKFDILNKYKVFFTKEQIEEACRVPDRRSKNGKIFGSEKDGVKVLYKKDGEIIKVITFFPVR